MHDPLKHVSGRQLGACSGDHLTDFPLSHELSALPEQGRCLYPLLSPQHGTSCLAQADISVDLFNE